MSQKQGQKHFSMRYEIRGQGFLYKKILRFWRRAKESSFLFYDKEWTCSYWWFGFISYISEINLRQDLLGPVFNWTLDFTIAWTSKRLFIFLYRLCLPQLQYKRIISETVRKSDVNWYFCSSVWPFFINNSKISTIFDLIFFFEDDVLIERTQVLKNFSQVPRWISILKKS